MTTHSDAVQDELTDMFSAAAGVPVPVVSQSGDQSLEDLGLDSLAAMEVQAVVKDRFGVLIPDDSLEMSFAEITQYVIARLGDN